MKPRTISLYPPPPKLLVAMVLSRACISSRALVAAFAPYQCSSPNHSPDKVPTNAPSKGEPNWPYLATYGYTTTIPTASADQLSFYDNDFDYHVGVVYLH